MNPIVVFKKDALNSFINNITPSHDRVKGNNSQSSIQWFNQGQGVDVAQQLDKPVTLQIADKDLEKLGCFLTGAIHQIAEVPKNSNKYQYLIDCCGKFDDDKIKMVIDVCSLLMGIDFKDQDVQVKQFILIANDIFETLLKIKNVVGNTDNANSIDKNKQKRIDNTANKCRIKVTRFILTEGRKWRSRESTFGTGVIAAGLTHIATLTHVTWFSAAVSSLSSSAGSLLLATGLVGAAVAATGGGAAIAIGVGISAMITVTVAKHVFIRVKRGILLYKIGNHNGYKTNKEDRVPHGQASSLQNNQKQLFPSSLPSNNSNDSLVPRIHNNNNLVEEEKIEEEKIEEKKETDYAQINATQKTNSELSQNPLDTKKNLNSTGASTEAKVISGDVAKVPTLRKNRTLSKDDLNLTPSQNIPNKSRESIDNSHSSEEHTTKQNHPKAKQSVSYYSDDFELEAKKLHPYPGVPTNNIQKSGAVSQHIEDTADDESDSDNDEKVDISNKKASKPEQNRKGTKDDLNIQPTPTYQNSPDKSKKLVDDDIKENKIEQSNHEKQPSFVYSTDDFELNSSDKNNVNLWQKLRAGHIQNQINKYNINNNTQKALQLLRNLLHNKTLINIPHLDITPILSKITHTMFSVNEQISILQHQLNFIKSDPTKYFAHPDAEYLISQLLSIIYNLGVANHEIKSLIDAEDIAYLLCKDSIVKRGYQHNNDIIKFLYLLTCETIVDKIKNGSARPIHLKQLAHILIAYQGFDTSSGYNMAQFCINTNPRLFKLDANEKKSLTKLSLQYANNQDNINRINNLQRQISSVKANDSALNKNLSDIFADYENIAPLLLKHIQSLDVSNLLKESTFELLNIENQNHVLFYFVIYFYNQNVPWNEDKLNQLMRDKKSQTPLDMLNWQPKQSNTIDKSSGLDAHQKGNLSITITNVCRKWLLSIYPGDSLMQRGKLRTTRIKSDYFKYKTDFIPNTYQDESDGFIPAIPGNVMSAFSSETLNEEEFAIAFRAELNNKLALSKKNQSRKQTSFGTRHKVYDKNAIKHACETAVLPNKLEIDQTDFDKLPATTTKMNVLKCFKPTEDIFKQVNHHDNSDVEEEKTEPITAMDEVD